MKLELITRILTRFFLFALHMLPIFYSETLDENHDSIQLDEERSKHIVQVLRMRKGERLELTDGKGNACTAIITDDHKKKVRVNIEQRSVHPQDKCQITIGISLLKNPNRFEWFLEKATEIGINEILPMFCERTERLHLRLDRMQNLLVSAMLQSRQYWMPKLNEPLGFDRIVADANQQEKFIAHCMQSEKRDLSRLINNSTLSKIILIGPEGDFTDEEVNLALRHQFTTASLGDNRLRAETAGVVAAALLKLK